LGRIKLFTALFFNETQDSLIFDFFEENPTLTLPEVEGILRELPPFRGGSGWGFSDHLQNKENIVYSPILLTPIFLVVMFRAVNSRTNNMAYCVTFNYSNIEL
jgi:hypothetical protein